MAHRADLNTLTPAQRTQLVNLMLGYLTDAVVADHTSIIHSGLELFTGHRAYILAIRTITPSMAIRLQRRSMSLAMAGRTTSRAPI